MFSFFRKGASEKDKKNIKRVLPVHLGIIMDGNGRWAKKRKLPRTVGHSYGADNFEKISIYCNEIGIKYATFYAFSTENWKRPKEEVDAIMELMKKYLKRAINEFSSHNMRLNFLGDMSVFNGEIKDLINQTRIISENKTGMMLNIALNYGGQSEIVTATKKIAENVQKGLLSIDDINENTIQNNLYTKGQPNVDLVIRTSGEYRTSNFLLWQSAYAEYVFTDTLWPDFNTDKLEDVLSEYSKRNRRYGGVGNG